MIYSVEWLQELTSEKTGNKYKRLSLKDETGVVRDGVAMFSTDPRYTQAELGAKLDIELKQGEYNGQVSWSVASPKSAPRGSFGPNKATPAAIAQAMDRKDATIGEAQDKKADGIQLAGTARDATLIVTTFYPEYTNGSIEQEAREALIKEKWHQWRDYLMSVWDRPF